MNTKNIIRNEHIIAIVRHGESLKNIKNRHGGAGEPLTDKGKEEVKNLVYSLGKIEVQPKLIYCSNIPQVLETSYILLSSLEAKIIFDDRIRPLDLGVLSGLSREESLSKYPESAILMERWRRGEIEICQLQIPLAEDLFVFWERGVSFLDSVRSLKGLHIIIGTRSILTLLINILLNRGIQPGGGYKVIEIPTGSLLTFSFNGSSYQILENLNNFRIEGNERRTC